ncbi:MULTISPECIES: hypothetical protein [unclassified Cyanobium]|uniref:hypothetical protein n=1 Tax=unclassified Cyanobium TaxID=2627006 RepID=UPI0020CF12B2|nr:MULTISPECIES: hypothetical protein [unclassified Cyanobium]MCP9835305.1 hypothetical protein [Cyanobium sp. La Preciosa 7G6]MCP9938071.1 hypothetical protein [Cyanobium sp. Aljojuca 7A6]
MSDANCSPLAIWDIIGSRSVATPVTQEVLNRIRRGDAMAAITMDHPQLTQAQISLVQHLQIQELELNRLYKEMQNVEQLKMQVERELARSLLRAYQQSTTSP